MSKKPSRAKERRLHREAGDAAPAPQHERAAGDKPAGGRPGGNGKEPPRDMGDWLVGDPH